ncbi:MAG: hypothetical protein KatS3mg081_1367 [Gemmatimonadales bacterium]|nr:MAG: hypothetical protein KatS3mg081_1367 [Gemmatimonadales bacterium]
MNEWTGLRRTAWGFLDYDSVKPCAMDVTGEGCTCRRVARVNSGRHLSELAPRFSAWGIHATSPSERERLTDHWLGVEGSCVH